MNYLLKNNKQDRGVFRYVAGVFITLAIIAFFYFFGRSVINTGLFAIARPLWNVEQYVSGIFWGIIASVEDKARLQNQNTALRQELDGTQALLQTLDAYKKENETLKNMLGRESQNKRVVSAILAKPNQSLYDTLVLDVGEKQGVMVGNQVMSGDFVIGVVREVYSGYSKAVLFSSPGEMINVLIGDSNISAQAQGLGGGNFSVKLPKEISVANGDLIRMPGINQKFFGTVSDVLRTAQNSFEFILFSLPININSISWVEVEIQ